MSAEVKFHEPVRNRPVAKFFYKGTHSHPVRRTVLIIENMPNYIRGYELREGSETRSLKDAPIKTYRKSRIATQKQCRPCKSRTRDEVTTFQRMSVIDLLKTSI